MAFANDRDLILLEPGLFREIAWTGQALLANTDGVLTGTSLTSATGGFQTADVQSGHIVLVNNVALEVVARVSDTELTISRIRDSLTEPAQATVLDGSTLTIKVWTFSPQIQLIHEMLLRSIELDPTNIAQPSAANILNSPTLARLEALGTLHLIFSSVGAAAGPGSPHWERASLYRKRFATSRESTAVELDTTGDGNVDTLRRFAATPMVRS